MRSGKQQKQGPEILRSGSFTARLYTSKKTVSGKAYAVFRLAYVEPDGRRRVRDFADRKRAKEAWALVSGAWGMNRPDALSFTEGEIREHNAATAALEGLGVSLYEAAAQYAAARRKLPGTVTLLEAVEDYARRHPANAPVRTVAEVVAELLADRTKRGRSGGHLRDIPQRLEPFAARFPCSIASVSAQDVRGYLEGLTGINGQAISPRSRENARRLITTLFNFSRRQRYVSREHAEEIGEIEAERSKVGKIEIFEPWELTALLAAADDSDRPLMAIAAFCGLRTSELQRLEWESVRIPQRSVILEAAETKTGSRRVVPISDNLAAWLAPYSRAAGRISRHTSDSALSWSFGKAALRAGVEWKRNAMRHSFISYRLSVTTDVPKVAYEAGNSPRVISTNYLQAVTTEQGKAWFSVRPQEAANVIPLPVSA